MGRSGDCRRFRELSPSIGAAILFTRFGPGWAEAFLGIPGDGRLIGAEAKYGLLLRKGIGFPHRHATIRRLVSLYFEPGTLFF